MGSRLLTGMRLYFPEFDNGNAKAVGHYRNSNQNKSKVFLVQSGHRLALENRRVCRVNCVPITIDLTVSLRWTRSDPISSSPKSYPPEIEPANFNVWRVTSKNSRTSNRSPEISCSSKCIPNNNTHTRYISPKLGFVRGRHRTRGKGKGERQVELRSRDPFASSREVGRVLRQPSRTLGGQRSNKKNKKKERRGRRGWRAHCSSTRRWSKIVVIGQRRWSVPSRR